MPGSAKLKSLKTISKITRTMKAVSAAKYARGEKELNWTRACGKAALEFYERMEVFLPQTIASKTLYVAVTSDRGLCGACNIQVCKFIKDDLEKEESSNSSIMCIGVIGTNIFKYYLPNLIVLTVDKMGRKLPNFIDASKIALQLKKLEDDFNHVNIIYNESFSLASYRTQQLSLYSTAIVYTTPKLLVYGNVDLEDIQCYLEFSLAMILYYIIRVTWVTEQGARYTAMLNASNNVDNILEKESHLEHKRRQMAVTKELLEIVATAVAMEKKN